MRFHTLLFLLCLTCSACPEWASFSTPPLGEPTINDDPEAPLLIAAIDIGQGDATLIETSSGDTILIDAGPPESGYADILPTLDRLGVRHLSALILSHYDADHMGGAIEVLSGEDRIPHTDDDLWPEIGLYDRGEDSAPNTTTYLTYHDLTAGEPHTMTAGDVYTFSNGLRIQCVIANGAIEKDGDTLELFPELELSENARSIGLLIRYGDFSYWSGGDLPGDSSDTQEPNIEAEIADLIGPIDLLHLHHHGSDSSSSEDFLDVLSPKAAIISAGEHNRYGHPSLPVVNRLLDRHIDLYATHTYDDAIFETLDPMTIVDGTILIYAEKTGEFEIDGTVYR